jgi:hypothetical protein
MDWTWGGGFASGEFTGRVVSPLTSLRSRVGELFMVCIYVASRRYSL